MSLLLLSLLFVGLVRRVLRSSSSLQTKSSSSPSPWLQQAVTRDFWTVFGNGNERLTGTVS